MEFVSKKGDILFIGEPEEAIAVTVLNTIKYENNNYLHVIAMPLDVGKLLFDEDNESEFVREVASDENYELEPVVDKRILDALNQEVENMRRQKEAQ
ncbi:MAG: hypothetical protein E7341_03740 [Clostridiales bacterium]|nr:hypothetical protein [Clostridiales bacterium]